RHSVDANLVRAVIKVESNFNPNAVSRKGAMGLMQLMPATARELNVSDPFDPEQNLEAGVRHLKSLLETNSGDVPRTLAAYNAGQGAVARSGGIPPYAETRNYVRQITHLYGSGSGTGESLAGRTGGERLRGGAAGTQQHWAPAPRPLRIAHEGDGTPTLTNVY
ncbi:MAG: lytic transglycosylase domain-containing protein, partial [Acidobacteria bacterium]|nr:lytic transglycosylase domain-containing protein [Acidobacteriota bacterium]